MINLFGFQNESQRRKINLKSDINPATIHIFHFRFSLPYIKNKKILDVGCWTGLFDKLAVKYAKHITGLDPSKQAISLAKKQIPQGTFLVGTAEKLPFPKHTFDTVCYFQVMEHLPKNTEVESLQEIYRVLKPKGRLLLSIPDQNILSIIFDPAFFLLGHRHYSVSQIEDFFSKSGFKLESYRVRGGFLEAGIADLLLLLKHSVKIQPQMPDTLKKIILKEYEYPGFYCLYIVARKI